MSRAWVRASLEKWERKREARRTLLAKALARKGEKLVAKRRRQLLHAEQMIALRRKQLAPPPRRRLWHPGAKVVRGVDAGRFVSAKPKIVWHTTEGSSIEGAIGAYRAHGSWPHFTFDPWSNRLVQHIPLNRAARALEHPAGTAETNRAHTIQVELVGRAAETPHWKIDQYRRIAALARWIEYHAHVERECSVEFVVGTPRIPPSTWLRYRGHCGHSHVPANHHWDPGRFRISDVI